ncbi:MAG: hypothetical protein ACXVCR_06695 [Bdellovibrio sp.]
MFTYLIFIKTFCFASSEFDIKLKDGWINSPLTTHNDIWIKDSDTDNKKVLTIKKYDNSVSFDDPSWKETYIKSLSNLEMERNKILSIFGIKNWKLNSKKILPKFTNEDLAVLLSGQYLNQDMINVRFVELLIFDKKYIYHIGYFENEDNLHSSNPEENLVIQIGTDLMHSRLPAASEKESNTEGGSCNCYGITPKENADNKSDIGTVQNTLINNLCEDTPAELRKTPSDYKSISGFFHGIYNNGPLASNIGCGSGIIGMIGDIVESLYKLIETVTRFSTNKQFRKTVEGAALTLIAEAKKDPPAFLSLVLEKIKTAIGKKSYEFKYCYHDRAQADTVCKLAAELISGGMLAKILVYEDPEVAAMAALEKILTKNKQSKIASMEKKAIEDSKKPSALSQTELSKITSQAEQIYSSNMSEKDKVLAVSRLYVEARVNKLDPQQQKIARKILSRVKSGDSSSFWYNYLMTDGITIEKKFTNDMLTYHVTLAHELEHLTQYLSKEKRNRFLNALIKILRAPVYKPNGTKSLEHEVEAIGAEWDLLSIYPKQFISQELEKKSSAKYGLVKSISEFFNTSDNGTRLRLTAALEMSREKYIEYIRHNAAGYHGRWAAKVDLELQTEKILNLVKLTATSFYLEAINSGLHKKEGQ